MKDRLIYLTSDATGSDNVGAFMKAGSDGDPISSTNIGGKEALDVNIVGGADSGIFAEDSAHSSGDKGQFILVVRNDTQGTLAGTDGDYAPLQVDSVGRLRVITDVDLLGDLNGDDDVDSEDPLKVGTRAVTGPLGQVSASGDKANMISDRYRRLYTLDTANIAVLASQQDVDNAGEVQLAASALSGRRKLFIQNLSNSQDIYIGATGVTTADGFQIRRGSTWEFALGADVSFYAVGPSATVADVRLLELA